MKKLLFCSLLIVFTTSLCLGQEAVHSKKHLANRLMQNPETELLVVWKKEASETRRQRIIENIGGQLIFSHKIIKADTLLFDTLEGRIAAEYKLNHNSAVRYTESNDPGKEITPAPRPSKKPDKKTKKAISPSQSNENQGWRRRTRMDETPGNYKQQRQVVVAIIGPGVGLTHPKINASAWVNEREKNGSPGIDDDHNGWIDDINGINPIGNKKNAYYDTNSLASTILALGNYSHAGINDPEGLVKIMPLTGYKGFYNRCHDWSIWTNRSILLNCIEYATTMGADMIVMPGYIADSRAVLEAVTSFPGLVFTGSISDGEDACDLYDPLLMFSGQKNIVAVSKPEPSYWGVVGKPGDLAADGFVALSCNWGEFIWTNSYTISAAGAAGTAARMKSVFPHLTDQDIKNLLISTGEIHLWGDPTRNKTKLNSNKAMLGRSSGGTYYTADWASITKKGPSVYYRTWASAWDEKRALLYFYGGRYEDETPVQFWVFNGKTWKQIEKYIFERGQFGYHQNNYMFYHPLKDCMALLEGDFSRIWFWDGKAWEFKDLPKNKFDFLDYRDRCFYDPNRDIIIYVGNEDGGKAGVGLHVYEFDWYNWKRIKTLEKGIEISNIYYNPSINKTVLIEYNHKKKVTDGLWEYDGKTLKRRSIPPIKGYPGLSYYNSKKNLYFRLVTGDWDPHSSKDFVDPWQFDGEKWQKAHFEFPHDLFWGFSWSEPLQKLIFIQYNKVFWQYSGSIKPTWIDNLPLPQSDYNGDGKADFALWRPSTGEYIINNKYSRRIGKFGGIPAPGDYDGDGRVDLVTVQQTRNKTKWIFEDKTIFFGKEGQIPVPGDYNGDGTTEIAVYDRNSSTWLFKEGNQKQKFGLPGDIPVPADYDGDGRTELATYTPLTSTWHIEGMDDQQFGKPGNSPVPADYDGDGRTDIALWDPAKTTWLISTPGSNKNSKTVKFGTKWAIPVPGDYNGDGRAELATFSSITGIWHIQGREAVTAGKAGDVPLVRGK